VFGHRVKQPWPPEFIITESWRDGYRQLAKDGMFAVTDIDDAASAVRVLIRRIDTTPS